ncbi:SDR family NAD(P)-dependent oxidoreductase [Helicobacter sp. MIT 21-1697]|uniref:SDR family NAD(P)-dependent oxidoreductase n=1 Tax=Helicobacter sp. MIT 21-1697 TaxID=2993733 RepID=UPI00224B7C26|nr:SDR family NAD(P)-dependent oxidoreductase [Helicobacter sp. MIT 21-1697]MCX2717053.1 SDR family NAD(P)-dependent oxidoreductase [Helicobacter sp. MIT 21-1697]
MDIFRVAITGASSGIGRALAMCFSNQATHLYLAGRNIERLEESKTHILALNPQVQIEIASFDISDEKACKLWCEEIFASRLDVLILNAGVAMGAKESIQKHFEICHTNAMGVAYMAFYALKAFYKQKLKDKKKGQMVLVSSIAALLALPNAPSYSASKSFVKSLGESLSVAQKEVCITTICPGFIKTPLTDYIHPSIPQMSVEKAAKKMYIAIKKGKRFYAFPYSLVYAARFYNILPLWLKRILVNLISFMGRL